MSHRISWKDIVLAAAFAIFLLVYFISAMFCFGAILSTADVRSLGYWYLGNFLSICIAGTAAANLSYEHTMECRAVTDEELVFANSQHYPGIQLWARINCALVWVYILVQTLSLAFGALIVFKIPASMLPWYNFASQNFLKIQGPAPLVFVWIFYGIYWWLVRYTRNRFYAAMVERLKSVDTTDNGGSQTTT